MKRKLFKSLFTIACLLGSMSVSAYDFEVDGLYYNVISLQDMTAEVTKGTPSYTFETISIPSEVTYMGRTFSIIQIGSNAFYNCSSLSSITLPNSITSIGDSAFRGCSSLSSITLPNSITSIENYVFWDCSCLSSITIPENVISIGWSAFNGCSSLTSITFPESVTTIESYAFSDCSSLISITIPENVTTIGGGVLRGCDNLESINIYSNTLKNNSTTCAFSGCSNVASLYISSNTNDIGDYVLSQDAKLKEIIIDDSDQPLNLGRAEKLEYAYTSGRYTEYAYYYGCFSKASETSLEKIYLGRNLSYEFVPFSYFNRYSYGNNVKEIHIGDYVTSLDGLNFFSHTKKLETLTIGKGLSTVPSLSEFSSLTSLTLTSEVPQKASEFTNAQYINLKVYVPKGSLETYQSADIWKNFWNLQEIGTTDIDHAVNDGQTTKETKRYDATGREINSLQKGLNIIKMSDGTTKKVIVK